ncbi:metallophosphoesterase [Candidatus Pacearchaeota archaeon]|nr:metallophosphoesterase [Candidatus Pacearchaeota archaeon]
MDIEILNEIRKKGLLLEKDVLELLEGFGNSNVAKEFLEQIERISGERMITKKVLSKNVEYVRGFVGKLGENEKSGVEKIIINLGLTLEVKREILEKTEEKKEQHYKIFYANTLPDKKLEVKDFVGNFRSRYQQLQRILMGCLELQNNLVAINKIGSDRSSLSIIGIVSEKRITKNNNLMISFEDLTGRIKVLVKPDKKEIWKKADELQLDDIVGVKASGNRDILFAQDIFYPDAFIYEKTKFDNECCAAFLSDIHVGSDRHLGKNFERFLSWINSDDEIVKKIKYVFFVGDNVDGVGIFPGQEGFLELKSMNEQYDLLASYLRRVPKRITMFMCPGQHDAVRVAEPQPIISRKYARELYEIDNLVLVTNPTLVKLEDGAKEFKVLMYHGASLHNIINEIKELREMKAHRYPAKAVEHLLKRRHLAPTHSENTYIPNAEKDALVIEEVPDVLCIGEMHRSDISNYHGILIITGSCWQAQTPFEEKVGNVPDPCKVPVLNLKTRELKVFDFTAEEE